MCIQVKEICLTFPKFKGPRSYMSLAVTTVLSRQVIAGVEDDRDGCR